MKRLKYVSVEVFLELLKFLPRMEIITKDTGLISNWCKKTELNFTPCEIEFITDWVTIDTADLKSVEVVGLNWDLQRTTRKTAARRNDVRPFYYIL